MSRSQYHKLVLLMILILLLCIVTPLFFARVREAVRDVIWEVFTSPILR